MRAEIEYMREALASYIEATYHLTNPKVVDLGRRLLTQGGIARKLSFVAGVRSGHGS